MKIRDRKNSTLDHRRVNDALPGGIRDPSTAEPPVHRVLLLLEGGGQNPSPRQNVRFRSFGRIPDREYVVKGLHKGRYLTDYLSVQERTEKQVTPLFPHLTIVSMKGQRKASTPAQWRKEFISRVKAARIMSGKKPIEVATELGVNLDTYNRWETRALLPHHVVMPFCRVTGADPVMLLTGSPFDLGKALAQGRRF